MSTCRPTRRTGRGRAAAVGTAGPGHENNFCRSRNRQGAWALTVDAGWSAPQPPTPHPSGDRPWPLRAPGSSFWGKPPPRWNPLPAARLDVPARSNPHVGCRRRVGGPVLKGDTRRPFFSERSHRVGGEPETPIRRRKTRQTHFKSIGLGNSGDFAANAPPWDQNGSPYCGDGRFFEITINSNGLVPAS
jgi:hypothetical protein